MYYSQRHRFYCGVDLHAGTMFLYVLDHKGGTVFADDPPDGVEARVVPVAPRESTSSGPGRGSPRASSN